MGQETTTAWGEAAFALLAILMLVAPILLVVGGKKTKIVALGILVILAIVFLIGGMSLC